MQLLLEICQNRTTGKDDFFETLLLLKSKSGKLQNVAYIAQYYAQKTSGHFDFAVILYDLNSGQKKSVSCAEIRNITSTFH